MTIWTIIFLLIGGVAGGLLSSVASMASLAAYPVLLDIGRKHGFIRYLLLLGR